MSENGLDRKAGKEDLGPIDKFPLMLKALKKRKGNRWSQTNIKRIKSW